MIPAIGTITNSIWGYYITASSGYTVPTNIPTWINTNFNGAWSPARQAPMVTHMLFHYVLHVLSKYIPDQLIVDHYLHFHLYLKSNL